MTYREESGRNWRLILGDCLEVMATLEPVQHVITDPPFEVEAHTKARRSLKDAIEIDFAAITPEEREAAAAHFARLASRWVIAFCQIEAVAAWRSVYEKAKLDWVRGGVWDKPNGAPQFTGDRPGQGFECLAIAHHKGRKRWNGGGKHAVWRCPLDHRAGGGGKQEHPTIKPTDLMLQLVEDFTDPGETILDPYAGSASTGVAALRLGRRFIGVEKNPRYFDLACERLRAEESNTTHHAARAGQVALFGEVGT
jgi:site-specific DNA-methyltransferase (adenine-specific)